MAESTSNYSAEMVEDIIARYEEAPTRDTVNMLAEEHDRPVRGIIAKLVQAGVYIKQERVASTKAGAPVVRKAELVEQIQAALNVEFVALDKASKADLETLLQAVS